MSDEQCQGCGERGSHAEGCEIERLQSRVDELENNIENACLAAAETQPSWKHRCYQILDALGFDYGDPDCVMPDDRKRISELEAALREDKRLAGESLDDFLENQINYLNSIYENSSKALNGKKE